MQAMPQVAHVGQMSGVAGGALGVFGVCGTLKACERELFQRVVPNLGCLECEVVVRSEASVLVRAT